MGVFFFCGECHRIGEIMDWKHIDDLCRQYNTGKWSFSKVQIARSCPKLFYARYVNTPSTHQTPTTAINTSASVVGRKIHEILTTLVSEPTRPFSSVWKYHMDMAVTLTAKEVDMMASLFPMVQRCGNRVRAVVEDSGLVPFTEHPVVVPGALGTLDLLLSNTDKTRHVIVDYKTARAPKKEDKKQSIADQLEFYALLLFSVIPEAQVVKTGSMHIPDENIVWHNLIDRGKTLPRLEDKWQRILEDLIRNTAFMVDLASTPNARRKVLYCQECNLTCKKNKKELVHG
jgi:hypothetical protein